MTDRSPAPAIADAPARTSPDPGDRPVTELARLLGSRALTSTDLVTACLERVTAVDPVVRAVLAVDDTARAQARAADHRHAAGHPLSPLDGIPVLVKDNIDTRGLAGTAGSRLLAGAPPDRDAKVVARLRAAGAVILGKTNLTEWGNFRSTRSIEGWSAVGGQTRNPYDPEYSPWGSSAGSAAAVAAGMAPLALGTETDGSLVCPAGVCGVAAIKPAFGTLPSAGVVPISVVQDTVGPLASRLGDAALCLAVLTGRPLPTAPAPPETVRMGLWHVPGMSPVAQDVAERAAERLRDAGAVVVPVALTLPRDMLVDGLDALCAEFRPSLERYLSSRRGAPATLEEIVAANRQDPVELGLFGQELFERCAALTDEDRALAPDRRRRSRQRARELLAAVLADHGVDVLMAATGGPAWRIDDGPDPFTRTSSTLPALAGHPNVAVPAGYTGELPLGISLFGPPLLETLLPYALLAERCCGERRTPVVLRNASLPRNPR
ncbi:amidase family protein [Streptomyces lancefieldiae]|uniref:Amidase family protein n=1 Tax=Streptomyces lancefieldiae TaxID=3075520 RepID=A0ABU3B1R3_9ACTN|nr:amidase family protein [Streptomyces sp. DSM 40712]MDT0615223.1 amidase family protein [Streptomyces sp. DSM 40712]